ADVTDRNPLASAFMTAVQDLGFPAALDLGGANTTGVGWNQLSIKGHLREDASTAYLASLNGVTVDLLVGTEVLGLIIENKRCIGLRISNGVVRPDIEVLLCAGAVDSPRLLMLSGIGSADHLRPLGIPVAIDLPDVGRQLEDHLLVLRGSTSPPTLLRTP